MSNGDNTRQKQGLKPQWEKGQSGNPKGRPHGARSKLSERFLQDMYDNWKENGPTAIEEMRVSKPEIYVKVVASILPKEIGISHDVLGGLSAEELEQYTQLLQAIIDDGGEIKPGQSETTH